MYAISHHICLPIISRPCKYWQPPKSVQFRPNTALNRQLSILTLASQSSTSEVDDEELAFWDYQFLFMSQRSEVLNPIKLKLVDGKLPKDFPSGTYYLIGPGLFTDDYGSSINPLDGHGYLRAFEIDGANGEVKFTAKYVKTEAQMEECDPNSGSWKFTHRGPFSVLKGGNMFANMKVMKNVANTSILKWGGRLFCLWEGGSPYEIDPLTLDTIGNFNLIDGNDNEDEEVPSSNRQYVWDVVAHILKPILHEFDSSFNLMQKRMFIIPIHSMIHDWGFTNTHYILFANRIKVDILGSMAAITGRKPMISSLSIDHSNPTSPIYILPRFRESDISSDSNYLKQFIEVPQLWLLHVANAYEDIDDDGSLLLRVFATTCSYRWFNFQSMFGYSWKHGSLKPSVMNFIEGKEQLSPKLVEVLIKIQKNNDIQLCSITTLNNWSNSSDFPIINPKYSGYKQKYVYASTSSGTRHTLPHFPFDTIVKLDTFSRTLCTWFSGNRRFVGEPMFVLRGYSSEDDGYLIVIEYVVSQRLCYLLILDAKLVGEANALVARFEVPKSLTFPLGFHGTWIKKE